MKHSSALKEARDGEKKAYDAQYAALKQTYDSEKEQFRARLHASERTATEYLAQLKASKGELGRRSAYELGLLSAWRESKLYIDHPLANSSQFQGNAATTHFVAAEQFWLGLCSRSRR